MVAPTRLFTRARTSSNASMRSPAARKCRSSTIPSARIHSSNRWIVPLGGVALFGQSSGRVDPLNLGLLAQKGSLYVTRPTLNTYAAKRDNLVAMANELFDVVKSGAVKIEVHQTYPLKDAAKAHADLAARKTTGSTVLTV